MRRINESLRHEYEAFRALRCKAEIELNSVPLPALIESCSVLDHLMRASEGQNTESEINKARQHLLRGCKDLYLLLLPRRLDKLKNLPSYLAGEDLDRFKIEYNKIKEMVDYIRSDTKHIKRPEDFIHSLNDIDLLIQSFSKIETEALFSQKLKIEKYKHILFAVLSALLGAVASLIFSMFFK